MSYFPYGEEQSATSNNKEKFGTYFRDQTTGFDYADQRYFRAQLGRFLTPDPYEGSARLDNPETWNRYAYTLGDPANFADPNGLDVCSMIDDGQTRDGIKDAETETCRTVKPVFGGGGDIASELRYTSQVVAAVVNAVVSASNAVVSASLGNGNFAGGETPSVSSNITYPEADTPIGDLGQAVLPKVHETTAYLTTPTPYLWWLQNAAITGVGLPIAGGGTGLTTLRNLSSQG
jgi:RHS repeat-associated protein